MIRTCFKRVTQKTISVPNAAYNKNNIEIPWVHPHNHMQYQRYYLGRYNSKAKHLIPTRIPHQSLGRYLQCWGFCLVVSTAKFGIPALWVGRAQCSRLVVFFLFLGFLIFLGRKCLSFLRALFFFIICMCTGGTNQSILHFTMVCLACK